MTLQKLRLNLVVGTLFIVSAFLLGFDPVLDQLGLIGQSAVAQPIDITSQTPITKPDTIIQGRPVTVYLPDIGLQRSVVPGNYDSANQTWTLSDEYAHFATLSALPNNNTGNTFIYGHNTAQVFAPLRDIRLGNMAYVKIESGETLIYRFTHITEVTPEDVTVLKNTSKPTLSLQTCTGLWYQKRTIYRFDFIEVRS